MASPIEQEQRQTCTVEIEVPRFGFIKRRPDGQIDLISPLPVPFNYGAVPGTMSPDGDPLDAVVLGRRRAAGERVELPIRGTVDFIDGGDEDPKLIVAERALSAWDRRQIEAFFSIYAVVKRAVNAVRGRPKPTEFRGWRPSPTVRRPTDM